MTFAETAYRTPPGFGCAICGHQPQPVSPSHLGRWPTEVRDPEYPDWVVLCPNCADLDPVEVPTMIIRRRADRAVAWKRRQLSRRWAKAGAETIPAAACCEQPSKR